ncbi:MAG: hypothetical protein HQK77_06500 [Desulfobacterales bacterium]|nr:hypothetical protein [Desulfobacterales bacterium]
MNFRKFSHSIILVLLIGIIFSCQRLPVNHLTLYQRSLVIDNEEVEKQILAKASVKTVEGIKLIKVKGTPYEMGFQHGRLLSEEVRASITHVLNLAKYIAPIEVLDEVYDLMEPYIPIQEKEEMRGLAHGAGIPLRIVHWFHAIPELAEYGPKKRFQHQLIPTSCSNIAAFGKATQNGKLYQLRVLDWIRDLGVQQWPIVLIHKPDHGYASANFSYAGLIGCVTGMNEKHMAFGEMGYGNPVGERLDGIPFIFLFRKLMRESDCIETASEIIADARRTCSYVYLIGSAKEHNAILYVTSPDEVKMFQENIVLIDNIHHDVYHAVDDVVYGGAKTEVLFEEISKNYGKISPEIFMQMTKPISLKGNMQNVVFDLAELKAWVSNASTQKGESGKACHQPWVTFNFEEEFRNGN